MAAEYGLEINWKKSQILQASVEYLGHNISNGTVRPSADKIKAVKTYPVPKNLKEVHSFIGLTPTIIYTIYILHLFRIMH